MEFLNPTALYGLLALPLLVIPYLFRRKPRRYLFSSLFIFTAMSAAPTRRPWRRLRLPLIFFLQLLLLTLLVLALGEPVFNTSPSKVALVMDNSASMQALDNGRPRFSLAQERATELVSELGPGAVSDVYVTAPRLARVGGAGLSSSEAVRTLRGLRPFDLGEAPLDYDKVLAQLAQDQPYDRVYLITDHSARGAQGGPVRVVTVGQPQANIAITSLQVTRDSLVDATLTATARIVNFTSNNAKLSVTLRGGGAPLSALELTLAAGAQGTAKFEGVAPHPYYEAVIDARDALALDNRRFATPPVTQRLRVLGVSPRPKDLASLRAIKGVELDIVAPADYDKSDRAPYNLEIFHFSTPAILPRNPSLFILPPNQNELVNLGAGVANPSVSGWREGHRLTRYVNFSLFRPRYARNLLPQTPGESLVSTPQGPLVYAATKQGVKYLVLGFDPLPYLGQENLPMSIFTVNMIDWFFGAAGNRGKATGEPLELAAAQTGDYVITPPGEKISLRPGATVFPTTLYQGIYQYVRGKEKNLVAVNLNDASESDLRQPVPILISAESETGPRSKSVLLPLWPYFLLVSFLLLLLEWFIHPRPTPAGRRAQLPAGAPSKS